MQGISIVHCLDQFHPEEFLERSILYALDDSDRDRATSYIALCAVLWLEYKASIERELDDVGGQVSSKPLPAQANHMAAETAEADERVKLWRSKYNMVRQACIDLGGNWWETIFLDAKAMVDWPDK